MIQPAVLPEAPGATCSNCGAALARDQRYCLSCGHPCSPVRLAFLDVLQGGRASQQSSPTRALAPGAYPPAWEADGTLAGLQRYAGVFGLLTVLLVAGLIGLLVGHWVSAGSAPSQSVLKIDGLGGLAAAAPAATSAVPTTPTTSTPKATKADKAEVTEDASEAAAVKAPPPAPKKAGASTLEKLGSLKGKKYRREIDKLADGDQPIETGGG